MKQRMTWHRTVKFALTVAAMSFFLGGIFDSSTVYLNHSAWFIGAIIVLIIILVGVIFDMLGLAAAAARETPFHAMASKRVFGAKRAIFIVRNAEKVSSVCSDVVGDIAGVLSGAGALAVSTQLAVAMGLTGWYRELTVIATTALITAITVGLKAIGKTIAIHSPTPIVLFAARFLDMFSLRRRAQAKT